MIKKTILYIINIFALFFLITYESSGSYNTINLSNNDSIGVNNKRLLIVSCGKAIGITGSMIILDQMWYSNYPRSSFQFHNDMPDWKQMDKFGHTTTAYHISLASYELFKWTGLNNRKSALYGSITSTLFMTSIEVLDGFSEQWGFSWGDQAANMIGSGVFYAQQLAWEEQKVKFRYSFSPSGLDTYRPELLGSTTMENFIKDYNGMTFWLSSNINLLIPSKEIAPPWLNIAIGYSANGMLGSIENPTEHNGKTLPEMKRYRQYFLAPDIDFTMINTNSRILDNIFKLIDFSKFPSPAIEYNEKYGWSFHLIYY